MNGRASSAEASLKPADGLNKKGKPRKRAPYSAAVCTPCRRSKKRCNGNPNGCDRCAQAKKKCEYSYVPDAGPTLDSGGLTQVTEKVRATTDDSLRAASGNNRSCLVLLRKDGVEEDVPTVREANINRSFSRQILVSYYHSEMSYIHMPFGGTYHMDVAKNYEQALLQNVDETFDGMEESLGLCYEAITGVTLFALGEKDLSLSVMHDVASRAASCPTVTVPLCFCWMQISSYFLSDDPVLSKQFADLALAAVPALPFSNPGQQLMFLMISSHLATFSNIDATLNDRIRSITQVTVCLDAAKTTLILSWAPLSKMDDPDLAVMVPGAVPIPAPQQVDASINALRGCINYQLHLCVDASGGAVIHHVDALARNFSSNPFVRRYGLMMVGAAKQDSYSRAERDSVFDGVFKSIGDYNSLLHILRGMYSGRKYEHTRFRAATVQMQFTCRALAIIVLWQTSLDFLAIKCAREFVEWCRRESFVGGAMGSYVLPLAMMIEFAFSIGNHDLLNSLAGVTVQIQKSDAPFPDYRRDLLVDVANALVARLGEPTHPGGYLLGSQHESSTRAGTVGTAMSSDLCESSLECDDSMTAPGVSLARPSDISSLKQNTQGWWPQEQNINDACPPTIGVDQSQYRQLVVDAIVPLQQNFAPPFRRQG